MPGADWLSTDKGSSFITVQCAVNVDTLQSILKSFTNEVINLQERIDVLEDTTVRRDDFLRLENRIVSVEHELTRFVTREELLEFATQLRRLEKSAAKDDDFRSFISETHRLFEEERTTRVDSQRHFVSDVDMETSIRGAHDRIDDLVAVAATKAEVRDLRIELAKSVSDINASAQRDLETFQDQLTSINKLVHTETTRVDEQFRHVNEEIVRLDKAVDAIPGNFRQEIDQILAQARMMSEQQHARSTEEVHSLALQVNQRIGQVNQVAMERCDQLHDRDNTLSECLEQLHRLFSLTSGQVKEANLMGSTVDVLLRTPAFAALLKNSLDFLSRSNDQLQVKFDELYAKFDILSHEFAGKCNVAEVVEKFEVRDELIAAQRSELESLIQGVDQRKADRIQFEARLDEKGDKGELHKKLDTETFMTSVHDIELLRAQAQREMENRFLDLQQFVRAVDARKANSDDLGALKKWSEILPKPKDMSKFMSILDDIHSQLQSFDDAASSAPGVGTSAARRIGYRCLMCNRPAPDLIDSTLQTARKNVMLPQQSSRAPGSASIDAPTFASGGGKADSSAIDSPIRNTSHLQYEQDVYLAGGFRYGVRNHSPVRSAGGDGSGSGPKTPRGGGRNGSFSGASGGGGGGGGDPDGSDGEDGSSGNRSAGGRRLRPTSASHSRLYEVKRRGSLGAPSSSPPPGGGDVDGDGEAVPVQDGTRYVEEWERNAESPIRTVRDEVIDVLHDRARLGDTGGGGQNVIYSSIEEAMMRTKLRSANSPGLSERPQLEINTRRPGSPPKTPKTPKSGRRPSLMSSLADQSRKLSSLNLMADLQTPNGTDGGNGGDQQTSENQNDYNSSQTPRSVSFSKHTTTFAENRPTSTGNGGVHLPPIHTRDLS